MAIQFWITMISQFHLFRQETPLQLIIKEEINHIIGNKMLDLVWINTFRSHNLLIFPTKSSKASFQKVQSVIISQEYIHPLIKLDIQNRFYIKMSQVEFLKLMVNIIAYTQPIIIRIQIKKLYTLSSETLT
jgi:hypothetical protein